MYLSLCTFIGTNRECPSCFFKKFDKVFETQLSDFFDTLFNPFLCAFRRGHGCQTTLLRLLEDWREALDKTYCTVLLCAESK